MAEEPGQDLDVYAFVIAVCGERVAENMHAHVAYAGFGGELLNLVAEGFVGKVVSVLIAEDKIARAYHFLMLEDLDG